MQEQTISTTSKILRLSEVKEITGLSKSCLYDKQNPQSKYFDPNFPKKIQLGARAVGWLKGEVEAWVCLLKKQSHQGGV